MKAKLVASYVYRGRDGEYLYEKQRFEPGFDDRPKTFRFRRPLPAHMRSSSGVPDGQESWVYGIQGDEYGRKGENWNYYPFRGGEAANTLVLDACEPVLYRWLEMVNADPSHPVLVVEGEKDVDLLRILGFVAVCGPNASSVWLDAWSAEMDGRRVCVIPDNNVVGYKHADDVVGSLLRHNVAAVRVARWDDGVYDPGPGGGIGNWLPRANPTNDPKAGRAAVIDLCKRTPEYAIKAA